MIPELGHFALILALLLALVQAVLPLAGAARADPAWMAVARPAALAQALFTVLAWGCLAVSFVASDFSVANVANHSNASLPAAYRFAATWGSHEGSMLLWTVLLAAWTAVLAATGGRLPAELAARVLGVLGLVSAGFLAFLLFTSNPFARLFPVPADGRDLNPLLQDPGMVLHPPLLYMGYVGFAVAFAFALAALLAGRADGDWAARARPWTAAAWAFLTLGIAVGSWWAYTELGWGGWWFWDPVENASLMPWLAGTALLHSLAATARRGNFRGWTTLLAIVAFSLSLLGTFLVRSGVLTSVHAFATDPRRGVFILAFLAATAGGSLALYAWRAPRLGRGDGFAPVSRDALLLANNMLLVVAAATVLLGTLYPLLLDAAGLGRISVGPPYFEAVFVPIAAPLVLLVAIGPLARWRHESLPGLAGQLAGAAVAGVLAAVALPLAFGRWGALPALGFLLAAWVATGTVIAVRNRLRTQPVASVPSAFWGMALAHLGMAVFVAGVTVARGYESGRDLRLAPGESVTVGARTFRFEGTTEVAGPNYAATRGRLAMGEAGRDVGTLAPEKRAYPRSPMPTTEAAIDWGLLGDYYAALGEPAGDGAWTVRLHHKPLVGWIWGGCLLMALGGFVAAGGRRSTGLRRDNTVEQVG